MYLAHIRVVGIALASFLRAARFRFRFSLASPIGPWKWPLSLAGGVEAPGFLCRVATAERTFVDPSDSGSDLGNHCLLHEQRFGVVTRFRYRIVQGMSEVGERPVTQIFPVREGKLGKVQQKPIPVGVHIYGV